MERYLLLNDYRNIGIEKPQKLKINSYIEKGSLGDLILLLAQNNTGKSNVLNALMSVNEGRLKSDDKPDFIYDKEVSPSVKLCVKDENVKYEISITTSSSDIIVYSPDNKRINMSTDSLNYIISKDSMNYIKILIDDVRISTIMQKYYGDNTIYYKKYWNVVFNKIETFNQLSDNEYKYLFYLLDYADDSEKAKSIKKELEQYKNRVNTNKQINTYKQITTNNQIILNDFEKKYGFKLIPKIVNYSSKNIKQSSLNCYISSISSSDFYKKLFKIIDVDIDELIDVYNNYKTNPVGHILRKYEDKINKKLNKMSKHFNSVYCYEKGLYKFQVALDKDTISFSIIQNNNAIKKYNKEYDELPLNLDRQSTGFKWFFDFYFDVLASNALEKGDIIIMDEAVVHLHPSAVIEWRKIIKDFSKKSGITFVLASHNPALTELDHLDEIRLLKKNGNEVVITNNFSLSCDGESKDVMLETLKALTVPMHVIYNPSNDLFFVEGITDYNYLIAFKQLFNFENINFMPFNGVKDDNLNEKLKSIMKKPIVLLDADKAGRDAKVRLSKDNDIEVHLLSDVDEKFTDIESLFEGDDKKYVNEKNIDNSVYFKNNIKDIELNEKTKSNFKKLFDNILM